MSIIKYIIAALLGFLVGQTAFLALLGVPLHAGLEFRFAAIAVATAVGAELYRRIERHAQWRDLIFFAALFVFVLSPSENPRLLLAAAALGGYLVSSSIPFSVFGLFLTLGLTGFFSNVIILEAVTSLLALFFAVDCVRYYKGWQRKTVIVCVYFAFVAIVCGNYYYMPYRSEAPRQRLAPASVALPSVLMSNRDNARILLVSGFRKPPVLPVFHALPFVEKIDFLKHSGGRSRRRLPENIRLYHGSPAENSLSIGRRTYTLIFVESLPEISPYRRQVWIRQLLKSLGRDGVFVLPRQEILSLKYRRNLPGSRGAYVAWSDSSTLTNDIDRLDERLERLQTAHDSTVMLPGIFGCLYEPELESPAPPPEYVELSPPSDSHYWVRGVSIILGLLYFLLRLYAGRFDRNPVRMSLFENTLCFTLVWLTLLEQMPIPLTYGIAAAGLWFIRLPLKRVTLWVAILALLTGVIAFLNPEWQLHALALLTPMLAFCGGTLQKELLAEMREVLPQNGLSLGIGFAALGIFVGLVISIILGMYSPVPAMTALLISSGLRLPWLLGL